MEWNEERCAFLIQQCVFILKETEWQTIFSNIKSDPISMEILNPIELGKTYDDKDCILDLKLRLNGDQIINIELQILNPGN